MKMRESSCFLLSFFLHRHVLCLISLLRTHSLSLPPSLTINRALTPPKPDSPYLPGDSQSIHPFWHTALLNTAPLPYLCPPSVLPSVTSSSRTGNTARPNYRGTHARVVPCERLLRRAVLCAGESNTATMSTPRTEH